MEKHELQRLRDLPIEGVAERLGLRVVRHKSLCPFHEDSHPSLSFNVRKNTFRCFVCDASGGTIDLVMRHLRLDFREACRWLADAHNVILEEWKPAAKPVAQANSFAPSRYARFFERPWLSDAARRFLFEERRLDARVIRWCRITSWRDRNGVEWLQTPYYDMEGRLIGVQNRNLCYHKTSSNGGEKIAIEGIKSPSKGDLEGLPRFRFPAGSRCSIYNLPVLRMLRQGEPLFITEGCSDCWAMLSAGHKAIAIPSATLLMPKDKELLHALVSEKATPLHMYPDQDVPGERLFLKLKEVLPMLEHHQLPAGCKDFSEYYLQKLIQT